MGRRKLSAPEERVRQWEYKNLVHGKGYYDKWPGPHKNLKRNMSSRGYDVMRVSPKVSRKHGLAYRVVYGGTVEPGGSFDRGGGRKPTPLVKWYKQGYVKAQKSQRTGTVRLQSLREYDQVELRWRLMEPKRKPSQRRKPKPIVDLRGLLG